MRYSVDYSVTGITVQIVILLFSDIKYIRFLHEGGSRKPTVVRNNTTVNHSRTTI